MSFLLGMDPTFFKPRQRLFAVGQVLVKDLDMQERFTVSCFTDTGTLFIDGRFAPAHLNIGDTLSWYLRETIMEIDIEELYFDNLKMNGERPAHSWEKRTFLLGHWKQYAKNDIQIRMVIRLRDDENESVYLTIPELQPTYQNNKNEPSPKPAPLIIQPFS